MTKDDKRNEETIRCHYCNTPIPSRFYSSHLEYHKTKQNRAEKTQAESYFEDGIA